MVSAPHATPAPAPAPAPEWIAVDWGTSRLRIWAMAGERVLDARSSDQGMGQLAPDGFEPALLALAGDWLDGGPPVIACGMVGARGGWAEAGYRAVPCPPLDPGCATRPPVRDARLHVHILPGLSQSDPPDVMRGEETQIAGFLAESPGFTGTLCLPGTHCKWAQIAGGRVERLHTFMTGELYSLLAHQSVLRLTIGDATPDAGSFAEAAAQALDNPELVPAWLFPLRAAALLHAMTPRQAAGRLSGLLVGSELAAARPLWDDAPVAVIGAPELAELYRHALADAGAHATRHDGAALVLAGLCAAHSALKAQP